jgi:hypothetical protein
MMTVRLRIKARTGNVSMPREHWSFRNARSDPAEFGLGTFPAFDYNGCIQRRLFRIRM